MYLLLTLLACGGETAAPPTPPPAAAPPPAATPPPAPVAVGPDGPPSIPAPNVTIPTDPAAIAAGEGVFGAKGCGGCHKFGEKLVGPDLNGLFSRRTQPWIERMILAPEVMIKEDPVAKDLYRSLMTPMPKQGVTDAELPNLLAYIKSKGG